MEFNAAPVNRTIDGYGTDSQTCLVKAVQGFLTQKGTPW